MPVGLIGWYGHRNAGDERILYCLRRFFAGQELLVTSSFDDALARIDELNACSFVLLGGGGLILRGTGRFSTLIERLRPRFGCVGISIETRHADNQRMLDALTERAEFILVRDARSREHLRGSAKTIVGPDLTFLYPYEPTPPVSADVWGLNLRPWRFWPGEHLGAFDRAMRRLTNRLGALERLYPFRKWEPQRAVAILRQQVESVVPIPLYLENDAENDWTILSRYFREVPADFTAARLQECRYLVGVRLHALIFACQMAVPFLSLSYQPKNEELCKALHLPELSLDLLRLEQLSPAIDRLKSEHAKIRANLLDVSAAYHREITTIMAPLRRLVCSSN